MQGISSIKLNPTAIPSAPSPPAIGGDSSRAFRDLMLESIGQVNSMQLDADASVKNLMTGGDVNPAEVLTAVQKADMSFKLMMQIRNKLVQAYQELKDVRV